MSDLNNESENRLAEQLCESCNIGKDMLINSAYCNGRRLIFEVNGVSKNVYLFLDDLIERKE